MCAAHVKGILASPLAGARLADLRSATSHIPLTTLIAGHAHGQWPALRRLFRPHAGNMSSFMYTYMQMVKDLVVLRTAGPLPWVPGT